MTVDIQDLNPESYLLAEITFEKYWDRYAGKGYEWVEGVAFKEAVVTIRDYEIREYLRTLFQFYFGNVMQGRVLGKPFLMHLPVA